MSSGHMNYFGIVADQGKDEPFHYIRIRVLAEYKKDKKAWFFGQDYDAANNQ